MKKLNVLMYLFSPSVLPCSTRQAIPDDAPYQKSKWFYTNPRHPRTRYFNEILPQIYTVARPHMSESAFESYLFTEREKRWKLKGAIEKLEHNVSYLLSDKNPACFGQYTTPHIHPTPKDLNNCKRGIQELSSIKADVDAKLIQLSGEYQGLFDDKGNKCKKWASEQKLYCESLNEKLSCLKQKLSKALTDIENNLTPSAQALSRFSAAKGKKRTRSQKENRRKAKKRKEERFQSAVYKTMKSITLDLWTIENLCFPEGYNISSTSQHSLCEEELNIDNFDSLGRSAAEHLTIMKNQGLFALDAFEVVDNTIQRICYLDEA